MVASAAQLRQSALEGKDLEAMESVAGKVILESQIRGERTIAKVRLVLIAIFAGFAVSVFIETVAQNGLASELNRPDYYYEALCLVLGSATSIVILRITSRGGYSPWMRFLPSFIDVSCVATAHWAVSSSINLSYAFTGATVWFYSIFIVLSVIRNSAASVIFTGAYSAVAFASINTAIYAAMGNFVAGGNVYANASRRMVRIDFDDEIIKTMVLLVLSGILALVSRRFRQMIRKQIELQEISERYSLTLRAFNCRLEEEVASRTADLEKLNRVLSTEVRQRKDKEDLLAVSLAEKEVLLKEVHHRLKNNLQVIASIVNMQIAGTDDPRIEVILITLKNRIFGMSRVHDRLYRNAGTTHVDMDDYLRDLLTENVAAFQRPGLTLETKSAAPGTAFTIDRATTIGLIVSELVSNSMKHAFRGLARGRIEVLLRREGSRFELRISDDGIGLSEEAIARMGEGGSIGFLLIDALVSQLGGELRRESAGGLTNVITFS